MKLTASLSRAFVVGSIAVAGAAGVLAQQNSVVRQPRPEALPEPSQAHPNRNQRVTRPEGMLPVAPPGFSVTSYAEVQGARMMVYAPNGDLFVSSPNTNSITVLRDANNDGVFESRGTYAQGTAPAAPPPAQNPQGRGAQPTPPPAPAPTSVLGANAPACTPPPDFAVRGPGNLRLPFGLAFHDGYLYVGNTDSIVRYKYANGDLKAQGDPEKLLELPTGGHSTRNILFNRAGTKLYISVGSRSNNDAGEDCRRAAILEVNPDGTGYRSFAAR